MISRDYRSFEKGDIDRALNHALERLCEFDLALFINDASERSICHRLAMYLQDEFPDFDVDCEYNCDRNASDLIKRLVSDKLLVLAKLKNPRFDADSVTVFPDIIVHRRDTGQNLLVIEAKKTSSGSKILLDYDMEKLSAYKRELKYQHAKFLHFGTRGDDKIIFENAFK